MTATGQLDVALMRTTALPTYHDISLILQHNTRDEEEKKGNSIKMTPWNLLREELRCFEKKHPESTESKSTDFKFDSSNAINWERFIPQ